jgi:hypothetical protein
VKGLLISMIISDIVFLSIFIPKLTSVLIGDNYIAFIKDTVIKTVLPIISVLLFYYFKENSFTGFFNKIGLLIILNFIILIYFWLIVFSDKEKEHFKSVFFKIKSVMRKD